MCIMPCARYWKNSMHMNNHVILKGVDVEVIKITLYRKTGIIIMIKIIIIMITIA